MRPSGGGFLAGAALLLVLGACSAHVVGTSPTSAPLTGSTSTTSSPTSTPSPTTSDLGAEAVAAVEHFYAVLNEADRTRSSRELRTLFLEECRPCAIVADQVDELAAKNQTVRGGEATVEDLYPLERVGNAIGVSGTLVADAAAIVNSSGKVIRNYKKSIQEGTLWILRIEDGTLKIADAQAG